MTRDDAGERVEIEVPQPFDLYHTINGLRLSGLDPTARVEDRRAVISARTPAGAATLAMATDGSHLVARAWGAGASWMVAELPALLGANDVPAEMPRRDPTVAELMRRFWGLRIARAPDILAALVRIVLRQRVRYDQARRSWAALVHRFGEPAPGPVDLLLAPAPTTLAALPDYRFRQCDIDRQREATIRKLCAAASGPVDVIAGLRGADADRARRTLLAIPGIGPWSAGMAAGLALGDADALVPGDLHLPNAVAWTLAREPRADDQRMAELLEPYRGHRFRLVRLLWAGKKHAPR